MRAVAGASLPSTSLTPNPPPSFDKNETKARLTAEQRFQLLDAKLERTTREMLATSQQLEQLRYEQEQARSSTLAHILRVLKYALGHTRSGPAFWLFLPITAPRAAIEYVANSTSPKVEQGEVLGGGVESTSTGSEASGSSAEEVGRGASGRGYRAAVGRAQVGGRKGFR